MTVGPWSVRAAWVRGASDSSDVGWSALVELRQGVNLLVKGVEGDVEVAVELWAGDPEASDGLAVTRVGQSLVGVARIPLCTCGERGCGNAGRQLATVQEAESLPRLVDILRELPDSHESPSRGSTWDGKITKG